MQCSLIDFIICYYVSSYLQTLLTAWYKATICFEFVCGWNLFSEGVKFQLLSHLGAQSGQHNISGKMDTRDLCRPRYQSKDQMLHCAVRLNVSGRKNWPYLQQQRLH